VSSQQLLANPEEKKSIDSQSDDFPTGGDKPGNRPKTQQNGKGTKRVAIKRQLQESNDFLSLTLR